MTSERLEQIYIEHGGYGPTNSKQMAKVDRVAEVMEVPSNVAMRTSLV